LIAVDYEGNVALPFNTTGMYRGYVAVDGSRFVGIYT
jgi:beta-aspartyl-peptidase (threonine type)